MKDRKDRKKEIKKGPKIITNSLSQFLSYHISYLSVFLRIFLSSSGAVQSPDTDIPGQFSVVADDDVSMVL